MLVAFIRGVGDTRALLLRGAVPFVISDKRAQKIAIFVIRNMKPRDVFLLGNYREKFFSVRNIVKFRLKTF